MNRTETPQEETFEDIMRRIIPIGIYRNFICEKVAGGYKVLNRICKTKDEVDEHIDKSYQKLSQSIKH